MKSIIFFMLLGASLFNKGETSGESEDKENIDYNCLREAVQESKAVLEALAYELCPGKSATEEEMQENIKMLSEKVGCGLKQQTDINVEDELSEVGNDVGKHTQQATDEVQKILNEHNIAKGVLQLYCNLVDKKIQKKCLKNALKPGKVLNLGPLLCKFKSGQQDMATNIGILGAMDCVLPKNFDRKQLDDTSENTKEIIEEKSKDTLNELLGNSAIAETVGKITCTVKNVLDGTLMGKDSNYGAGLLGTGLLGTGGNLL